MAWVAGDTDGDRFDVRAPIGAGGMGTVYRAYDHRLGRDVALKTLRTATGRDLYRFKREFRSLADMSHPNLVSLHELHTSGDQWFFTMELVDGVSFLEWVRPGASRPAPALGSDDSTRSAKVHPRTRHEIASSRLDEGRLRAALPQLVEGVMALHVAGKLHRDLKPSNVLVAPDGRVVLLDFGLISSVETLAAERTHEMAAVGTPAYMSPEQAADLPLSEASDWYAVGVMLYEALTGRRPFEDDAAVVLQRKQSEVPPSPLDLDPTAPADLADLASRLLVVEPDRRPTGAQIFAALGRDPSPALITLERVAAARPFVGRVDELAALHGAFADSARHTVAVLLSGESGIGKSQLVRQFLDEVAGRAVVLEGRCYQRESVPFKTLDTLIDALTAVLLGLPDDRLRDVIPPDVATLARLFPVLRRVPVVTERSVGALLPGAAQELRTRAFAALRALLQRLAATAPLVITVDDLQWGDTDSAVFLAELVHHPEPLPLLLVLIHRPDEDTRVVERIQAPVAGLTRGDVRDLHLGPLGDADAMALVRAIGGGSHTGEALIREASGHPLFLAELARTAGRTGDRPATLEELIVQRIAALPPEAATLLRVVAVAAQPVPLTLASRAAGLDSLGPELAVLRAERLVRVRHLGDDDAEHLEPYHDRVRAAATSQLDLVARRLLHEALARAHEQATGAHDLEALVAHWMEAVQPARASEYAVQAARAAEAGLAFHRAAALYALAIEHGVHDAAGRRVLHRCRGDALANAGHLMEAAAEYAAAARGAAPDDALELDRLRLDQLLRHGAAEEGLELSRRLMAGVGVELPTTRKAAVRAVIGQVIRNKLRGLGYRERTAAEVPAADLARADLLFSTATGLALVDPLLGLIVQSHFLRAALDAGEPRRVCLALSLELGYRGQGGLRHAAGIEKVAVRVRELSERIDDQYARGVATCMLGYVNFELGRWRESRALLEAGLKTMRDHGTGVRWETNVQDQVLLTTLFYLGDAREAVRLAPRLLREAVERGDTYAQDGLRAWRGNMAWLLMGRPDDAIAHVEAVAMPPASADDIQVRHFHELMAAVNHDLYRGDGTRAQHRIEDGWPAIAGSALMRIQILRIEGALMRGRAALAAAPGLPDAERSIALRAVRRMAGDVGREGGWAVPIADMLRGLAAIVDGDRARAASSLDAAEHGFVASDMQLFVNAVRLRRGQLEGGATGTARVAASREALRDLGVADPDAVVRMLCPSPT